MYSKLSGCSACIADIAVRKLRQTAVCIADIAVRKLRQTAVCMTNKYTPKLHIYKNLADDSLSPLHRRSAQELMRKPHPLAVNSATLLDPLRSVQFSSTRVFSSVPSSAWEKLASTTLQTVESAGV